MALDYDLHLSTSMKPAQALEKLASQLPGLSRRNEGRASLFDRSVQIVASEPLALTQSIIKDAFRFTPALSVGFRRLPNADWDGFRQVLLDASLLLLDDAQDTVLLFNGERIEFQTVGGQFVFNAESGYWRDKDWLRRRLTIPFERRPLPSPLL
ncbi:MAG: SitI3 family protein [Archangium sp.]